MQHTLEQFFRALRAADVKVSPAEAIDASRALVLLGAAHLDQAVVRDTLNVILKFEQDIVAVEPQIVELMHRR